MGIELDLFCLNANYSRSDRLRSSAPSNSFASALPGWSFYLEDLHWGKVGMGSEPPMSRLFVLVLWCSQFKSLWSQDLWTERRVYHQLTLCPVQVHWVSVSLLAATSTGYLVMERESFRPVCHSHDVKCSSERSSCQSLITTGKAAFSLRKPASLFLVRMIIKGKKNLLRTQLKMVQEIRKKIKH